MKILIPTLVMLLGAFAHGLTVAVIFACTAAFAWAAMGEEQRARCGPRRIAS